MWKTDKLLVILAILIFLLILGLDLAVWLRPNEVGKSFFQFKLTDVLQIATTLIVGVFVSYFLSKRTSHEFRRREIYSQLLDRIQRAVESMYAAGGKYIDTPDPTLQKKVVASLKSVGIVLTILRSMRTTCDFADLQKTESAIVSRFIKTKAALTDSPFGQAGASYTVSKRNAFHQEYQLLLNEIYKCKIQIFR
jgi:hypothetical protein